MSIFDIFSGKTDLPPKSQMPTRKKRSQQRLAQLSARLSSELQEIDALSDEQRLAQFVEQLGVTLELSRAKFDVQGRLIELDLKQLNLNRLPSDIGYLINLTTLNLSHNQLTDLPPEIGYLTELTTLRLYGNRLKRLTPEIGNLSNLTLLNLSHNQLTELPAEVGYLTKLSDLFLDRNPIESPPPEIFNQGLEGVLSYLRNSDNKTKLYEGKLIVVGEGGTGKSTLIRALQDHPFLPTEITHGIEITQLVLSILIENEQNGSQQAADLTLNAWDFGGQQIYHNAHQFFLSRRALYVLVWNARLGAEQCGVNKWLANIKAIAPDSPVLLVATHIDEHAPRLNLPRLKEQFPNLVGGYSVSSKTGQGMDDLKLAIAENALTLPSMETRWPDSWLHARRALQNLPAPHLTLMQFTQVCVEHGVNVGEAVEVLAPFLHDLGLILYYDDDPYLKEVVILKPNWVSQAISRVLNDATIQRRGGALAHAELPRLWPDYPPTLYPTLLRLMERFDLSVTIPDAATPHSFIPLLMPSTPPNFNEQRTRRHTGDMTRLRFIYRFEFLPPDLMSWFIVRTYRYTTEQHWREGVILRYADHEARVELHPTPKEIHLTVWGSRPENFFNILDDTLEAILQRFENLKLQRFVPCPCQENCRTIYGYDRLVKRLERGKSTVECDATGEDVSLQRLLYGVHSSTDALVVSDTHQLQHEIRSLGRGQQAVLQQLEQLAELTARQFARQWNVTMQSLDADCPNLFIMLKDVPPGRRRSRLAQQLDPRNWASERYRLHLLCQNPQCPHIVRDDEGYVLQQPRDWWHKVSPWMSHMLTVLTLIPSMAGVAGMTEEAVEQLEIGIATIEQLQGFTDAPSLSPSDMANMAQAGVTGPALRALHQYLNQTDPSQHWAGLHKIITDDGNILWLCDEHRTAYER